MWTSCVPPVSRTYWTPNHFVPLLSADVVNETVDFEVDERPDNPMCSTPVQCASMSDSACRSPGTSDSETMPASLSDHQRFSFLKKKEKLKLVKEMNTNFTYLSDDSNDGNERQPCDATARSGLSHSFDDFDYVEHSSKHQRVTTHATPMYQQQDEYHEQVASDAQQLPGKNFLSAKRCIELLKREMSATVCDSIPTGIKENVFLWSVNQQTVVVAKVERGGSIGTTAGRGKMGRFLRHTTDSERMVHGNSSG